MYLSLKEGKFFCKNSILKDFSHRNPKQQILA